jgi:tetratricopeptide (TPR) repeat protein
LITPRIQAYAAEAYLEQRQPDQAVALLEQGIDAGSLRSINELRLVVDRAVVLLGRDEGLAALRRVLERATDANAELALRSTLAMELVKEPAERAEGLEMAKAVLAATPTSNPLHLEALLVQAVALEREGQYERVAQLYEELLSLAPNNPLVLNNMAYVLADKLGRAAEALQYAERLEGLASDNATILDTVGWVYFKNGRVDQAGAVFSEALRMDPRNLAACYHLGQVYADSGQRAAAQREFRRALDLAREQQDEDYQRKIEEALEKLR